MMFRSLTALLLVTACSGAETPPPAASLPGSLTSERGDRTIHTTAPAADRWESKSYSQQGDLLFEISSRVGDGAPTLVYRNHVWGTTETQTLGRSADNPLTFEQFHAFSIIAFPLSSVNAAQASRTSSEYDGFGCDWPMGGASCGRNGGCCDTHDSCYENNDCSAGSWLGTLGGRDTACDRCNRDAVQCFRNVHPGPSECCNDGNCGQRRTTSAGGGGGGCAPGQPWWECDPFDYSFDYTTLDSDYQDTCNADPSLCLVDN